MESKLLGAVGTLVGLTIGAGVLAIPYVIAQAGFFTGIFVIISLGLVMLLMNLYLGEITLRTKGTHQLPGYVEKYLGKPAKTLMTISLVITVYGALAGYMLGEGQAWSAVLGTPAIYPMLIFFLCMSIIIYRGLNLIKPVELCLNCVVLALLCMILLLSLHAIDLTNYTGFDATKLLLPYGVILFAFAGAAAIPDLKVELEKNKKILKKAIIIGSLIPLFLYLLFASVVIGVTGKESTELATIGLGNLIGTHMILLGNLFAACSMATSFLLLALALLWIYHFDYKMKKNLAWVLTLSIPLLLVLSGFLDFVQILAITGSLAGGIEGILIILTHRAAQKAGERKPEYSIKNNIFLSFLLIALYILGAVYMLQSLW